jgi:hypothetical protein
LTVESPVVVVVICNSEHYGNLFGWDTGYNTYGNQYPETGYWILRGDTKLFWWDLIRDSRPVVLTIGHLIVKLIKKNKLKKPKNFESDA